MTFHSILFEENDDQPIKETDQAPAFFADLHLDQVIDAVTAGKEEYNLKPLFYSPLSDVSNVTYRHEIMQDLESPVLFERLVAFGQRMRAMREHLAQAEKLHYQLQKEAWFLETVGIYCQSVEDLLGDLSSSPIRSRGLQSFREYLKNYVESAAFTSLHSETRKLKADLWAVTYCILIKEGSFTVSKYNDEADYSAEVEDTFERFKQGATKDYSVKFVSWPEMNHIEAKVLEFVAQLHPQVFLELEKYCAEHGDYLDHTISTFDREIQFYIAYLQYAALLRDRGLKFCYPHVSKTCKEVLAHETFDLALAHKLLRTNSSVVCNDFYLKGKERIFVVSGPNQGGKTTFARTFGQLHYLANIGCPVPGSKATLLLFDRLFTHFEREESIKTLRGKLLDDLVRIHKILKQATSQSVLVMNEIFSSTALQDAVLLSRKVMERIIELDLLCVWVTFIDELASFGEQTVSMVSTIVPEDPTKRTYKILRRPADGLSYAMSIAEKYGVTYQRIKERLR